jgi:hydrogenase maturation factor
MSAKSRILVDANVALDVLAKREPHYATSAAVWALAEQGKVEGLLAAHTVTTLIGRHPYAVLRKFGSTEAVQDCGPG